MFQLQKQYFNTHYYSLKLSNLPSPRQHLPNTAQKNAQCTPKTLLCFPKYLGCQHRYEITASCKTVLSIGTQISQLSILLPKSC